MMTIPLHIEKQVKQFAQHEHIAPDRVFELAMQSLLENYEDLEDIKSADRAKERLRTGESLRLSMNDAMRLLDELVN